MKWMIAALCMIGTSALAAGEPRMSFTYVPNSEDAPMLSCRHERIRDLPDWKVLCGNGEKSFTAHVIIRRMDRAQIPQTSMEILYWVTEPGDTPTSVHKFHSTTALIHLRNQTDVYSMTLYQGVENDQASLRMWVEF